jgi:PAT family beta-lactamase induction signal transducer AmpG
VSRSSSNRFDKVDVGVEFGTIGLVATIVGAILGGAITTAMGLGHSLWLFGFLQAFSNIGYVAVATSGVNRPLMYTAMAFETGTSGMGTGAFSVLLLRLTQKKFSATQYALLSSIFALGRTVAGPLAGVMVDAMGWPTFFAVTILAAAPGLVMLQRFVPLGMRDPIFIEERAGDRAPLSRGDLVLRALGGGVAGLATAALFGAFLEALRALRADPASGFALAPQIARIVQPATPSDWTSTAGVLAFGAACALATAALAAARRGVAR